MPSMGRIFGLSAIHFAAQFVVLVLDFAAVMRRFDAPDPAAPRSFYEGVVEASWTVLSLPIARPLGDVVAGRNRISSERTAIHTK